MAMAGQGLHAAPPPRPAFHNSFGGGGGGHNPGNQLYVGNVSLLNSLAFQFPFTHDPYRFQLPYQAGWQDLKDLFRQAGNIIRADINIGADGRPKGSGTVILRPRKMLSRQSVRVLSSFSMTKSSAEIIYQVHTMVMTGTVVFLKFAR